LLTGLFEAQAQLAGTQIADKVFDSLEEAFVTRLQHRLQPFVDTLLPEIRDSHAQLQKRTVTRLERRQSTLDRFKQIATLITDECRLTLPTNETTGNLLGFASWDVANHDQQENE
jgi:nitrogenase subunit NifH